MARFDFNELGTLSRFVLSRVLGMVHFIVRVILAKTHAQKRLWQPQA